LPTGQRIVQNPGGWSQRGCIGQDRVVTIVNFEIRVLFFACCKKSYR
jgi:hypothetical protein